MAVHDDHGGMQRDLPHLLGRRDALRWLGGASLAGILAACGMGTGPTASTSAGTSSTTRLPSSSTTSSSATTSTAPGATTTTSDDTTVTTAAPGDEIPDETAGPFPADGSNGPNVLTAPDVVRSDLTESFAGLSGTALGVPITMQLTIVEAGTGRPMPGAVVYLWHCTADGAYSIYEIRNQNFLRGAQVADDGGRIAFQSVFPGCYRGRWPHAHFEVYESLDGAVAGAAAMKVSQLALPQADCEAVYTDDRYGDSAANLSQLSLEADGVFRDGWDDQLAVVAGSVTDGYTASLLVRV